MSGVMACLSKATFRRRAKAKGKEKEKEKTSAMIPPMEESGNLLVIQPRQLQFQFELEKQISCSLRLTNRYDFHLAFKVKTTNPRKYCVRPCLGVVRPHSTLVVIVTMQAQKEAPADMQCRDKFRIEVRTVDPWISVTSEMFEQDYWLPSQMDAYRLTVSYVEEAASDSHHHPPSPFNMEI